jgi:ABC-type branched-subunit amino acid transport system ATPase component
MGQLRLVEVARCLAAGARFILLDEPAAGLTRTEQSALVAEIRNISAGGVGILLMEHNFELICDLCDRVVVLDEGKVVTSGTPSEISEDEHVSSSYLGAFSPVKRRGLP